MFDVDGAVLWGSFVLDGCSEPFVTWISVGRMTTFGLQHTVVHFHVVFGLHCHLVVALVAAISDFPWGHIRIGLDLAELDTWVYRVSAMRFELLEPEIWVSVAKLRHGLGKRMVIPDLMREQAVLRPIILSWWTQSTAAS